MAKLVQVNGPFQKRDSNPDEFTELRLFLGDGTWQDIEVSKSTARCMLTRLQAMFPAEAQS